MKLVIVALVMTLAHGGCAGVVYLRSPSELGEHHPINISLLPDLSKSLGIDSGSGDIVGVGILRHRPRRMSTPPPYRHANLLNPRHIIDNEEKLLSSKGSLEVIAVTAPPREITLSHKDIKENLTQLTLSLSNETDSSISAEKPIKITGSKKRKNIFQLVKHLELALEYRRRKNQEKYNNHNDLELKIIKPTISYQHSTESQLSTTAQLSHIPKKSNKKRPTNLYQNWSQTTPIHEDISLKSKKKSKYDDNVETASDSLLEDDWVNVGAEELQKNIEEIQKLISKQEKNDRSETERNMNVADIAELSLSRIIKQLREVLKEGDDDSEYEDSDDEKPEKHHKNDVKIKNVYKTTPSDHKPMNELHKSIIQETSKELLSTKIKDSDIDFTDISHLIGSRIINHESDFNSSTTKNVDIFMKTTSKQIYSDKENITDLTLMHTSPTSASLLNTSSESNDESYLVNDFEKNLSDFSRSLSLEKSIDKEETTHLPSITPASITDDDVISTTEKYLTIVQSSADPLTTKSTDPDDLDGTSEAVKLRSFFESLGPTIDNINGDHFTLESLSVSDENYGKLHTTVDINPLTDDLQNLLLSSNEPVKSPRDLTTIDNIFEGIVDELDETARLVAAATKVDRSIKLDKVHTGAYKTYNLSFHFHK